MRSPHAFATLGGIDAGAAREMPSVLAVLTAADLEPAHYHSVSHPHPAAGARRQKMVFGPHRPALAQGRVLHVGEPVALVVAETHAIAQEAADAVIVDYAPLTPVVEPRQALAAEPLWPEAPANTAFDWSAPADPDGRVAAEIERAFAAAAHVVRLDLVNQRVAAVSARGLRVATASYDPAQGAFTPALRQPGRGRHPHAGPWRRDGPTSNPMSCGF